MKKGIKAKKGEDQQKLDEEVTGILKNVLKEGSAIVQDRIVNKFREDLIKVDRLFELHSEFAEKMRVLDKKVQDPAFLATLEEFETERDLEDAVYEKKLEEGLSVLENVDFLIAFLASNKDQTVNFRQPANPYFFLTQPTTSSSKVAAKVRKSMKVSG